MTQIYQRYAKNPYEPSINQYKKLVQSTLKILKVPLKNSM